MRLGAIGWKGLPDGQRKDDAAEQHEARHARGASRLHLSMGHREQATANDLTGISRRVEGQRDDGAPVGIPQECPCEGMAHRRKLAETVIDEEQLHQQRRAAEDKEIALCKPAQWPDAREAHRCQQQRKEGTEEGRQEGQQQGQWDAGDQGDQRLPEELHIHQLRLTPLLNRFSAVWKLMLEMVVITR